MAEIQEENGRITGRPEAIMNGLPVHISSRKDMRSWSIITGVRPERLIS